MTKAKSKATAAKKDGRSNRVSGVKPKTAPIGRRAEKARLTSAPKQVLPSTLPAVRRISKRATVLGMLSRETGTTIDAIVKATNWQSHSVRGFFAAVVRKKLKLDLVSQRSDGVRIYRIATKPSAAGVAAS